MSETVNDPIARHNTAHYKKGLTPFEYHSRKETDAREHFIAIAHQKLLRERLAECVLTEGVNQFVNCKELREQYANVCKDRYHGQIFSPGEEPNRQTPGLIVRPPNRTDRAL